jgi:glycosyltransferase involved in cell wall biosynthesis
MIEPFSFVTPTASADGYGVAGEMLTLAAVGLGADVQVIPYDWADERFNDPEFLALKAHESAKRDIVCCFFLPYALQRFQSRVTLSMTMFETDRMPDVWAALVERFADGMLVPSEHCRQVFSERVSVPVEVAPFGTDTDLYTFVEREERSPWVFLMSGLLHYRKGLEFALRAFREEFEPGEDVMLWLKTRRSFLDFGTESIGLADPRVRIIDEDYTREEMRTIYHSADVLLAPSRGEGSGLTPRDAMATGLPVIVTDWSGLKEIADDRYGWAIPVEDLEPAPQENSSYGRGVTGGGDLGNFARPSVSALRAAMRDSYENREDARSKGRSGAAWMRERWTWERCARTWLDAIEKLSVGVRA